MYKGADSALRTQPGHLWQTLIVYSHSGVHINCTEGITLLNTHTHTHTRTHTHTSHLERLRRLIWNSHQPVIPRHCTANSGWSLERHKGADSAECETKELTQH